MATNREKRTVLIVDDNSANLSVLLDYLRGSGFTVLVAVDGESAVKRAVAEQPQVILLDILMPGIDGFETCRRLKAHSATQDIPIIFITALANPFYKLKGLKLGAVDYLTKPLLCEEVLARINTHLTISDLQAHLRRQNTALEREAAQRKRVLEALQESRQRYRLLAENSTDMISRHSLSGVYRYVSPACRNLLGYEIEEMVGRSAFEFIHADDQNLLQFPNGASGPPLPAHTSVYRMRRKDDCYIWLETTNRVIYDPLTHREVEIIAVSRDVTERKQAEEALQKAHDELEQRVEERTAALVEAVTQLKREIADRERAEQEIQAYSEELKATNEALSRLDRIKDEFLANTSHELRTPLNGIIGIAESMIDGATGSLSPEQIYNLSMIVFSGRRLTNLVNDTLDLSKLRHRELELNRKAVDLHGVTEVVLKLSQPLLGDRPLRLINQLEADLPAVNADEGRVQQIMHNLIDNAIKFTPQGSVTVSAQVQGEMLAVSVIDTGIGLSADKLENIFNAFEQVDTSSTRSQGGLGLGLSIAKELVELHGGLIQAESTPGAGSKFTFTLPLHKWPVSASAVNRAIEALSLGFAPKPAPPLRPEVEPVSPTPARELVENKNLTILVVDDELINVQVLVNYLSMQGYAVVQAFDGAEALEAFAEVKPDLVLLDVMMPKLSGYEVCQKIRERYPAHELPVILLTAKGQSTDLMTGFEAGANDFLSKPFDKNELLIRVKTHLRLAKINLSYSRFVPYEFLRFLDRESIEDVHLGDQVQREMSILFSDIRAFTTLSEGMTPQENFNFLNSYLGRVSPVIRQFRGFVDKYIGDGVMALFPDKAEDALQAAIAIQQEVTLYNRYRRKNDYQLIRVGVGVHTGSLMLGIIGEEKRMEGTVIADAVNLAHRIEGLSKLYGVSIVTSEHTLFNLDNPAHYQFRFLDRVKVKGKNEPVSVFEILDGNPPDLIALKLKTLANFEQGLHHYHNREFSSARLCFERVLQQDAEDKAAQLYLKRATHLLEYGVPPDWEGVEALTEK